MRGRNKIKYAFGFLVLGAAFIAIMGLATMYLWNWLVPELFNGGTVTFLQAIGLIALGKLLTGFMGWGKGGWKHHRGWHGNNHWKQRWDAKMDKMTPEEREKFKSYYYDRCGYKSGWMKNESVEAEEKQKENTAAN